MTSSRLYLIVAAMCLTIPACAQQGETADPFPDPIETTAGVIPVNFEELATIPEITRMMALVDEPGTGRLFLSDMRGQLYAVSYDGEDVSPYLDLTDYVAVMDQNAERGLQAFAMHPQFGEEGTPGYGKFYTLTDVEASDAPADFRPIAGNHTHDSVLLEWTAQNPAAASYDGGTPRQLIRWQQPYPNHNGGHIAFNPAVEAGDADFGLLYVGFADGGAGGDPQAHAQNLSIGFGKIFRIDPLGSNSANGQYGIPEDNPFAGSNDNALDEIFAYGVRNPQRLFWDPANGNMFMSDIGQGTVEEVSPVTNGANLGWNVWEGSFRFVSGRSVSMENPQGDAEVTYPVAEFGQEDPLLQNQSAAIGGLIYRGTEIPALTGKLLFGDNPSGEIFYVDADNLPSGYQAPIRRVLLNHEGEAKTFLEVIRAKNAEQGRDQAGRADLRFGEGRDGKIYLLNKGDSTLRVLVP